MEDVPENLPQENSASATQAEQIGDTKKSEPDIDAKRQFDNDRFGYEMEDAVSPFLTAIDARGDEINDKTMPSTWENSLQANGLNRQITSEMRFGEKGKVIYYKMSLDNEGLQFFFWRKYSGQIEVEVVCRKPELQVLENLTEDHEEFLTYIKQHAEQAEKIGITFLFDEGIFKPENSRMICKVYTGSAPVFDVNELQYTHDQASGNYMASSETSISPQQYKDLLQGTFAVMPTHEVGTTPNGAPRLALLDPQQKALIAA